MVTIATLTSGLGFTDSIPAYQTAYNYEVSALAPGAESASTIVSVTAGSPPAVVNGSFESPAVADGFYDTVTPGWFRNDAAGGINATINPGGPATAEPWPSTSPPGMVGSNFGQLYAYADQGSGFLIQDTGIQYQAGATYTLTAAFGLQTYQTFGANCAMFIANSSLTQMANKTIVASNLVSGAFTNQSTTYTATGNESPGNGVYGTPGDIIIGFLLPYDPQGSYLDFDNVCLSTPARNLANYGFEAPLVNNYQYNPTGAAWTFSAQAGNSGSGICANGSQFASSNPAAPEGTQVAFVQSYGAISQQLTGLIPGATYTLTFAAAERANKNAGGESWNVTVGGQTIASFNPGAGATAYNDYSAGFVASSANATLTFGGTDLAGGDNTVLIDNLRLAAGPKTFAEWQQQYFTLAQIQNPAISGPSADANGDGVTNLMACALGISPLVQASGSLPVIGTTNGHLTLTFPEPKGLTNWTTTVEVSSDLVNWYSGAAYTTQISVNALDANRNLVTVLDNTATSATAQRFMRLKVTLP